MFRAGGPVKENFTLPQRHEPRRRTLSAAITMEVISCDSLDLQTFEVSQDGQQLQRLSKLIELLGPQRTSVRFRDQQLTYQRPFMI